MTSEAAPLKRSWHGAALGIVVLASVATSSTGARAQFFWDQPRLSADDAARVAIQHGYRVLARPSRNDDVYVVEVIDRRGDRERLIIAGETGQILQRIIADPRRTYRTFTDPSIPSGPVPPGNIPNEERRPGFFARLFGGDDDHGNATDVSPPAPSDRPVMEPDARVRPPHPRRQPRVVEQAPDFGRPAAVESAPLAPPSAAPKVSAPRPAVVRPPAEAALPPSPAPVVAPAPTVAVTPPADKPTRAVSHNPLAIPGSREQDEKLATPAAPSTKAAAAPAPQTNPSAPTKPAVPVAPLE